MAQETSQAAQTPGGGRLTIGVPSESVEGEKRVSLIPEAVGKLVAQDVQVVVQSGAGTGSSISDDDFTQAGARVVPDAASVYNEADLIVKVQSPIRQGAEGDEVSSLRSGQMLISLLAPLVNHDLVRALADENVTALAMDAVPRITRAQSMDALSAMSTIGGYKAVLLAADHLPKFFPLLMTAAGTIRPAKVLVLGAGVAGLQAIATARRLGAVVEAYDTRPVVKEQVESLGAKFVEIDTGASDTQTAGGYAREATPDELRRQQEGLNDHIANSDVVITTALVPGRPAPKLIPASAVERMPTGSVIVDLAAETGGNCELTAPGEIVTREGVTIIGLLNLPSLLPLHASQMYSRVVQNFLGLLLKDGQIDLNLDDEIIRGMTITKDGEVIQEQTRKMMGLGEAAPPPAPEPEPEATEDVAMLDEPMDEPSMLPGDTVETPVHEEPGEDEIVELPSFDDGDDERDAPSAPDEITEDDGIGEFPAQDETVDDDEIIELPGPNDDGDNTRS